MNYGKSNIYSRIAMWFFLMLSALPWAIIHAGWRPIGPWGGEVEHVAVSPTHPEWLACSVKDRLFLSEDRGLNWRWVETFMPDEAITEIIRAPWSDDELWIVTQWGKLFSSQDGGITWRVHAKPDMIPAMYFFVRDIVADPQQPGWIYICIEDTGTTIVVARTLDRGEHWTEILRHDSFQAFILTASPSSSLLGCICGPTFLISGDSGGSWEALPNIPIPNWPYAKYCSISSEPTFYVGDVARLFRLEYGSPTWESLPAPSNYITDISVSALNPDRIILSTRTDGVYVSSDCGQTWTPTLNKEQIMFDLEYLEHDVLLGAQTGFFISEDDGVTYSGRNTGINGFNIRDMEFDPHESGALYAVSDLYLWRSDDSGDNWRTIDTVPAIGNLRHIFLDPYHPDNIILTSYFYVVHSSDQGDTWNPYQENLQNVARLNPLTYDPGTNRVLLASYLTSQHSPHSLIEEGKLFYRGESDTCWNLLLEEGKEFRDLCIDPSDSTHWTILKNEQGDELPSFSLSETRDSGSTWNDILAYTNAYGSEDYRSVFSQISSMPNQLFISLYHPIPWFSDTLPYTLSPLDIQMEYEGGKRFLFRFDTGKRIAEILEWHAASDILFLDDTGDDYLLAANPVCRAGRLHLQVSPVSDVDFLAMQLLRDPLNQQRILASVDTGSIMEFILSESQPPLPPEHIRISNADNWLRLQWELPNSAVGTKIYVGDDSGNYSLRCIVPNRRTSHEFLFQSHIRREHLYVRLSSYDANGKESEFSEEFRVRVTENAPRILAAGFLNPYYSEDSDMIPFMLWADDPQGIETLNRVELICGQLSIHYVFHDDDYNRVPSDGENDGLFSRYIYCGTVDPGSYYFQAVVVDEDGNHSDPWPPTTVMER